ncbi:unnamed protein product, partial [Urochloa humidicola]
KGFASYSYFLLTAAPDFPLAETRAPKRAAKSGAAVGFTRRRRRSSIACALVIGICGAVRRSCEIEAGGTRIGDPGAQCRVGRHGGGGGGGSGMARGIARAVSFGGRATAGWCSYRRITVAVCLGNLVFALLVLRSLIAPSSFAPTAPNRGGVVQYTEEQIKRVEESIRIRREAEPVELVQAVKKLRKVFAREEKRRKELPLVLQQKISYDILRRLQYLGDNGSLAQQREVVESWRAEKLKDIKSASAQNQSNLDLSSEETRLLKRALEFDWRMVMEDIGLWIPEEVTHTVHDDKPENEPEEEEIIAGPPLSPQCNAELHTDYDGAAVRWGLTHHKESAADCCQACLDQAKNAKPGEPKCNIWVYCPSEFGCYSPDKYEHKHQECWLKQADRPKLNFKDKYSESYRDAHPTAPVVVPWMSGVISA